MHYLAKDMKFLTKFFRTLLIRKKVMRAGAVWLPRYIHSVQAVAVDGGPIPIRASDEKQYPGRHPLIT